MSAGFFCHCTPQEGFPRARISLEHNAAAFVNEPAASQISNNAPVERSFVNVKDVVNQRTMKVIPELGKCIVFNMAVTNTDDHLRNHAFILTDKGWILSPLYDVNPVPYGDELSLNVDEEDNSISIDLAVQTAVRFGVSESDAEAQAEEILKIVRGNWEKTAAGYVLTRRQIEEMRPAFSACYE